MTPIDARACKAGRWCQSDPFMDQNLFWPEAIAKLAKNLHMQLQRIAEMASKLVHTVKQETEILDTIHLVLLSTKYSNHLANELLVMCGLQQDSLQLQVTSFDVRACVEEAIDIAMMQPHSQQLTIGYEMPQVFELEGDRERLQQLVVTLLLTVMSMMGCTYSARVQLSVKETEDGENVRFMVSNEGQARPLSPGQAVPGFHAENKDDTLCVQGHPGTETLLCSAICQAMGTNLHIHHDDITANHAMGDIAFSFSVDWPRRPVSVPEVLRQKRALVLDQSSDKCFTSLHCEALGLQVVHRTSWKSAEDLLVQSPFPFDVLICTLSMVRTAPPLTIPIPVPWLLISPLTERFLLPAGWPGPSHTLNGPVKQSELQARLQCLWVTVQSAQAPPPLVDCSRMKAIVISGNALEKAVLTGFLKRLGCTPDSSTDPKKAIRMACTKEYQTVFLDCDVPGMDLQTILSTISTQQPRSRIILIAADLSSVPSSGNGRLSFSAVIEKPSRFLNVCQALQECQSSAIAEHPASSDGATTCPSSLPSGSAQHLRPPLCRKPSPPTQPMACTSPNRLLRRPSTKGGLRHRLIEAVSNIPQPEIAGTPKRRLSLSPTISPDALEIRRLATDLTLPSDIQKIVLTSHVDSPLDVFMPSTPLTPCQQPKGSLRHRFLNVEESLGSPFMIDQPKQQSFDIRSFTPHDVDTVELDAYSDYSSDRTTSPELSCHSLDTMDLAPSHTSPTTPIRFVPRMPVSPCAPGRGPPIFRKKVDWEKPPASPKNGQSLILGYKVNSPSPKL